MKLATSVGDFGRYAPNPAARVRMFEGTGFRHLDYDFYSVISPKSPFMGPDWMEEVKAAGKAAEQLGFDFVQAHAPNYNSENPNEDHEAGILGTIRSIEACAYLGIKNMVIHTPHSPTMCYPQDKAAYFEACKRFLDQLTPHMEKHNVNILVENSAEGNMGSRYFFLAAQDMVDFIQEYQHPLIHACWDTGHANMRGTDPYLDVLTLGSELRALHVQDNFGEGDEHLAPFMGTMPMDSLMQGLLKINYQGYFTFESSNILCACKGWPHERREFPLPEPARLTKISPGLKKQAVALLYQIGKEILQAYDCFEE